MHPSKTSRPPSGSYIDAISTIFRRFYTISTPISLRSYIFYSPLLETLFDFFSTFDPLLSFAFRSTSNNFRPTSNNFCWAMNFYSGVCQNRLFLDLSGFNTKIISIQGVSKKGIPQLRTINSVFFNACQ